MIGGIPAPGPNRFLPHMDIIDHGGNPHQLVDITPMKARVYLHISTIYIYNMSNHGKSGEEAEGLMVFF